MPSTVWCLNSMRAPFEYILNHITYSKNMVKAINREKQLNLLCLWDHTNNKLSSDIHTNNIHANLAFCLSMLQLYSSLVMAAGSQAHATLILEHIKISRHSLA